MSRLAGLSPPPVLKAKFKYPSTSRSSWRVSGECPLPCCSTPKEPKPLCKDWVQGECWVDSGCGGRHFYDETDENVREFVIRAKVPPPATRGKRVLPGMKRCGKCVNCPYVQTGRTVSATHTNYSIDINAQVDCHTSNVIYCINCIHPNCRLQYLGKTDGQLTKRFGKHRRDVEKKEDCSIGRHFNLPGHSVSDMRITIVEKVHNKDPFFLRNREKHFIQMFKTRLKGLNINT